MPDLPKLLNSKIWESGQIMGTPIGMSMRRRLDLSAAEADRHRSLQARGEFLDHEKNSPPMITRCYGFENGDWLSC